VIGPRDTGKLIAIAIIALVAVGVEIYHMDETTEAPPEGPRIVSRYIAAGAEIESDGDLLFTIRKPAGWDVSPLKAITVTWTEVYHSGTCWGSDPAPVPTRR